MHFPVTTCMLLALVVIIRGQTVVQNTFTKDQNLDLIPEFRQNRISQLFDIDCFATCLVECKENPNCLSATFSRNNFTCMLYNKTFCFNLDTIYSDAIDLYGKNRPQGMRTSKKKSLYFLTILIAFSVLKENCNVCQTCDRYKHFTKTSINNGKHKKDLKIKTNEKFIYH
jgi:hypothetical protein